MVHCFTGGQRRILTILHAASGSPEKTPTPGSTDIGMSSHRDEFDPRPVARTTERTRASSKDAASPSMGIP